MRPFLVVAVLASPIAARADPPELTPMPPLASPPSAEDTSSYRLQTALADGAAIGVGILALESGSSGGTTIIGSGAVAMYLLGAPLVHLYHHHHGRAAASLALRVGLPILGGIIGNSLAPPATQQDWGGLAGFVDTALGVMVGGVAASAIDIGFLSGPTESRSAPPIMPAFAAGPGQFRFGIGGTF